MVKDVKIVLGLNYGDEGKGQVVDYLSHQARNNGHEVLNVLTNGSAQRGHTVELSNGERHVFHHFGSGTLAGADTYFPAQFFVNPIMFNREYEELSEPFSVCHKDCVVVTPYHMMVNQYEESFQRHGSCGMGVWEAVKMPALTVRDLNQKPIIRIISELKRIRLELGRHRSMGDIYWSDELLFSFLSDCCKFIYRTQVTDDYKSVFKLYDSVIFENGQGLLLDQKLPDKDHLTPSHTDLTIPKKILSKVQYENLETIYVTRTYMTRHGNGPFPTECSKEDINPKIFDPTNVYNEWQGNLRYGHLDWTDAKDRIERFGKTSLAVTHTNEYETSVPDDLDIDQIYWFDNPTRINVKIDVDN